MRQSPGCRIEPGNGVGDKTTHQKIDCQDQRDHESEPDQKGYIRIIRYMCGKQVRRDQQDTGKLGGEDDFFTDRAGGKHFFQIHVGTSNL